MKFGNIESCCTESGGTESGNVVVCCSDGSLPVKLKLAENAPDEVKNSKQAYLLEAKPESITITGFGVPGLYFGVRTLMQSLRLEKNRLILPCMRILDWPDMNTRGHFMESRYGSNLMELDDWKHLVDHMAGIKMNQLVISVYGCWCCSYDGRVSGTLLPLKIPEMKNSCCSTILFAIRGKWIDMRKLPHV